MKWYSLQYNAIATEYRTNYSLQKEKQDALQVPDPLAKVKMIQKVNIEKSVFVDVVSRKKALKLSSSQEDSVKRLLNGLKPLIIKKLTAGNADFKQDSYERNSLATVLNEEQFEALFKLRNSTAANEDAVGTWGKLLDYGLVAPKDSAQKFAEIFNYHLALKIANDRFAGEPALRKANIDAINGEKPQIVKDLSIAQKSATGNLKSNQDKSYMGTFQW